MSSRFRCCGRTNAVALSAGIETNVSLLCYNSITEQGQMFWVTVRQFARREVRQSWFRLVSMVSIKPGIRVYAMASD